MLVNGKPLSFSGWDAATIVAAWNATDIVEFREAVASVSGEDVILTARTPGVPFEFTVDAPATITVSTEQDGRAPVAQIQTIVIPSTATGGTWTFTLDLNNGSGSFTSAALAYNCTAGQVETALAAHTDPDIADIDVEEDGGSYRFTFGGAYIGTSVTLTADGDALVGVGSVATSLASDPGSVAGEIHGVWMYLKAPYVFSSEFAGIECTVTNHDTGKTSAVTAYPNIQDALDEVYGVGQATIIHEVTDLPGSSIFLRCGFLAIQFAEGQGNLADVRIGSIDEDGELDEEGTQTASIRLQTDGELENHEFVLLYFEDGVLGETFTITHDGNTTTAIAMSDDTGPSDIETALEALASLTSVTVHSPQEFLYVIEFEDANADQTDLTVAASGTSDITVTVLKDGGPLGNTIQRLRVTAASGTFTLSDGTDTTSALAYNISAAALKTELEADIAAIDDVTVTGAFPTWFIEFGGTQAETSIDLLSGDASSLVGGVNPTVLITRAHVTPLNEKQVLTMTPNATGGTFDLYLGEDDIEGIAYDILGSALQTAINAALGASSVTVTKTTDAEDFAYWTVEFSGNGYEATNLSPFRVVNHLTVSAGGVTVSREARSGGPNHLDDPLNWSGQTVLTPGDVLVFEEGETDVLFGLRQFSTFTVASNLLTVADPIHVHEDQPVRVWTASGTLPAELDDETDYYVVGLDQRNGTFYLSDEEGGDALGVSAGTGDVYVGVPLAGLVTYRRYSGKIGLPQQNESGYREYRPRFMSTAFLADSTVEIGRASGPTGSGSPLVLVDVGTLPVAVDVLTVAASQERDFPAMQLRGVNASNTLVAHDGTVGLAVRTEETATFGTVTVYEEAEVYAGPNAVITTIVQLGGEFYADGINSGNLTLR